MITFIFKMPFYILFVTFYLIYLIATKEYSRMFQQVDGNIDELMKLYAIRVKGHLQRLENMIPYFWAVIMLVVSFFIFKNNIS